MTALEDILLAPASDPAGFQSSASLPAQLSTRRCKYLLNREINRLASCSQTQSGSDAILKTMDNRAHLVPG